MTRFPPFIDVMGNAASYGVVGDGITNDSSAMASAVNGAIARKQTALCVSASAVKLNSNVDCKGLRIICNGTAFTGAGALYNHGGISNATVAGVSQEYIYRAPAISSPGKSYKCLYKVADDNLLLLTPRSRNGGYALLNIVRNVVTPTASVGGTAPLWRITTVHDCVAAYLYKHTYTAVSGSWTEYENAIGPGSGKGVVYWRSHTLNDYVEYTFTNGRVDVGFLSTAGSANSVIVAIDGATVETINLSGGSGNIITKRYYVTTGGTHTIRITNNQGDGAGGGILYVAGINFTVPEDYYGATIDSMAYGRRASGADGYYMNGNGAQDYAFNNGSLWAGSYHGGETVSSFQFRADGNVVDVVSAAASSVIAVARSFTIDQVTDFGWGSTNRFDTRSRTDMTCDGGWEFSCVMLARPTGGISLTEAHTSMSTAQVGFTAFDFPLSLTVGTSDTYTPLGKTEYVKQRNPSTGQVVEQFMTSHENSTSQYGGGAYVWGSSPSYVKVYSGLTSGCPRIVKSVAFTTRKLFS